MPRKKPPQQDLKILGELIRRKRQERSWSQATLAERVKVGTQTVLRWESGQSLPGYKHQRRLRRELQMSAEDFLLSEELQTHVPLNRASPVAVSSPPVLTPPPITRLYSGWRTGDFRPPEPGERPRYDYELRKYGAGETHVAVNGYDLDFFNEYEKYPYLGRNDNLFDWAYIGQAAERLAVSILANYFGEYGNIGKEKNAEDYQAVKYGFTFYTEVLLYLPYEKWELSSDEITKWLERVQAQQMRVNRLMAKRVADKDS